MSNNQDLLSQVDACVARICNLGCTGVYRTIEQVEAGGNVPEIAAADSTARLAVRLELNAVMAIYNARDGGASCKVV